MLCGYRMVTVRIVTVQDDGSAAAHQRIVTIGKAWHAFFSHYHFRGDCTEPKFHMYESGVFDRWADLLGVQSGDIQGKYSLRVL